MNKYLPLDKQWIFLNEYLEACHKLGHREIPEEELYEALEDEGIPMNDLESLLFKLYWCNALRMSWESGVGTIAVIDRIKSIRCFIKDRT